MPRSIDVVELTAPAETRAAVSRKASRVISSVHPFVRNVGLTGATSFITSVSAMLVISLVGRELGPAILGEYLLVRRTASWLQAVVGLPSGIALPRYVAATVAQPVSTGQSYFLAAFGTGCGLALLMTVVFILGGGASSHLLFGSVELRSAIIPLGLLMLGLAAHGGTFGFYQGKLSMGRASLTQLINLAILPILAVLLFAHYLSVPLIIGATGISTLVCSILFALPILRHAHIADLTRRVAKPASELMSFGFGRAWGDFGLQALFTVPAMIAAHYLPLKSVSFLLLGGSFLALVSAATLPLGIILLSQITHSLVRGETAQLSARLSHFTAALIESSVFVSLQMFVFAGCILVIWVGPGYEQAVSVVRILIAAVPFYFVYCGLRSVVDAGAIKAFNTWNILISASVFIVGAVLTKSLLPNEHLLVGLALSVDASLFVLACLTIWIVRRLFHPNLRWLSTLPGVGFAVTLGALSFALSSGFNFRPGFFGLLGYESLISLVFFGGLWAGGSSWLRFILNVAFSASFSHSQSSVPPRSSIQESE